MIIVLYIVRFIKGTIGLLKSLIPLEGTNF